MTSVTEGLSPGALLRALSDARDRLVAEEGQLPTPERLAQARQSFIGRFGPEVLASLDGEALLETMHAHGTPDSLVVWLEFKDDEEFPAVFGSISGGSALKFGLYRRQETGKWMTGSPQNQVELSIPQAIDMARRHRDQLIQGVAALEQLSGREDADYLALQARLRQVAPDVEDTAWGHKYFSVLFGDRLDDYHNEEYQRFHLLRLLQLPPTEQGRYVCAGHFLKVAEQLGWPLNHLTTVLNAAHGRPHRYWRVGTRVDGEDLWERMLQAGVIAVGWKKVGDLTETPTDKAGRELLAAQIRKVHDQVPGAASNSARQLLALAHGFREGDVVVAADGKRVRAIGKVNGPYLFDPDRFPTAPHMRPVDWQVIGEMDLPAMEGLRTTVHEIKKHPTNLLALEQALSVGSPSGKTAPRPSGPQTSAPLPAAIQTIQRILARKSQVILYGPPGTGKTYWAVRAAHELAALDRFRRPFGELTDPERTELVGGPDRPGAVRLCSFHPAYGYEDFLEGYRPQKGEGGTLVFTLRPGVFKTLCETAARDPSHRYYLIIDEINRGDIPRIFGELLTVLEHDKRGREITLPVSGETFVVPRNVHVIATMNTADRSIALLDTALRRRFGFHELMPDATVLAQATVEGGIPLGPWFRRLNQRIRSQLGRDGRNLQIGHAYFLQGGQPVTAFGTFARILAEDIIPLLEEYCYEDFSALVEILGKGLIDDTEQRVRHELFLPQKEDELLRAVLAMDPQITTAGPAAESDESDEPDELSEGEEGESEPS